MKYTRSRSILLVLASALFVLAFALGCVFVRGEHASAAEAELVPLAGEQLRAKKSYTTFPAGGGGVWWDAGHSQMRLFFDVKGGAPAGSNQGGQKIYNDSELIEITSGGETKTVKEWAGAQGAAKIQWVDNMEGAVNPSDAYEIWICSQQKTWIEGITEVHLKEGLFRKTEKGSTSGPALSHDYYLWNNGKDGWETSAGSLTVTYKGAPIDYAGSVKAEDFTVTATAKDGVTAIGTLDPSKYTIQYDSNTNAGEMTVTVKYQNATGTATVKVNPLAKRLESLTLSGSEATLPRFGSFEDLGVEVTANYVATEGGAKTSEKLSPDKLTVTGLDAWGEVGATMTANISYTYGGETKSAELDVTVGAPDTAKGLSVSVNSGRDTIYQPGMVALYFDFFGMDKPDKINVFAIDDFAGDHMLDYLELTSGETKTLRAWKTAGKLDWISISEDNQSSDYVVMVCSQDVQWTNNITKVTVKAGFQWATSADGKSIGWGDRSHASTYRNLEGAVVKEDVVLWRGDKWEPHAHHIEVEYADGEVYEGDTVDANKLDVWAYRSAEDDDPTNVVGKASYPAHFDTVGDAVEITVRYQDQEASFSVKVKKAPKYPTGLTLSKQEVEVKQFDALDLAAISATVSYDDGSSASVTLKDCTFEAIDSYTQGNFTREISFTQYAKTVKATLAVKVTAPDLTKGIVPVWGDGKTTLDADSSTQQLFRFEFRGIAKPDYKNLLSIEKFEGSHVADYIEITSGGVKKTAAQWIADGKLDWIGIVGGTDGGYQLRYCIKQGSGTADDPTRKANTVWLKAVTLVTFKAGFQWVIPADGQDHFPAAAPNSYANCEGAVVKQDYTLWNAGEKGWQRYADDIEVTWNISEVYLNDILDISKIGLVARYSGGETEKIPVTENMVSYSFEEAGERTITLTYQGHSATHNVTVLNKEVTGIEVETLPSKTTYAFGSQLDLTGAVVNKLINVGGKIEKEPIPLSELSAVYDFSDVGECTVTVIYGRFEASFTVTVTEMAENEGLVADWASGMSRAHVDKQVSGLSVTFASAGRIYGKPTANILTGKEENFFNKIEINGHPLSYYMTPGADGSAAPIAWVGIFGWELTIALSDSRLVWSDYADGVSDGTNNPLCRYDPETSELVYTIRLLKGLQWYTAADGQDHWGKGDGYDNFVKIEGAVLKEDYYLYNDNGYGWNRILEQAEGAAPDEGKIVNKADALKLVSLPQKTQYAKGESFVARGLKLEAHYEDGAVEVIGDIGNSEVKGFDKNKVGKQTLTFTFAGATVQFEVTVTDTAAGEPGQDPGSEPSGPESPGESGCSSVLEGSGLWIALAAVLGATIVVVFTMRKKRS